MFIIWIGAKLNKLRNLRKLKNSNKIHKEKEII